MSVLSRQRKEVRQSRRRWRRLRKATAVAKRRYHRAKARLARLRRRNRSRQLSPHFHVREFHCRDGTPVPKIAYPALRRLCRDYLEPLRTKYGPATVTSGYRPRAYNARIGGASLSQHIYDDGPESVAADVRFRWGTPATWAATASRLGAGGVGRYDRSGFVHVDNRRGKARWSG